MSSPTATLPESRVSQRQMWALRLLPVTAALGPRFLSFDIAGAGMFPFRVLVAVLVLVTLGTTAFWYRRRLAQIFLIMGLVWTVWSGFSVLWAPDLDLAIEQTVAIGFGLVVAVVMFNLGLHREAHLDALIQGWMAAYAIGAVFAVRELVTGVYLSGEVTDFYSAREIEGIAISLFDNPNNYAAFILLCVPFLLLGFARAPSRYTRWLALFLLASTPAFVFFSTSRLALIGIVVQFLVFAAIGVEAPRQLFRLLALGSLVVFLIGSFFWAGSQTSNDVETLLRQDYAITGSDTVRWNLTLNGLWMVLDTGGIGVGAGGYGVVTETEDVPYFVGDITDPHNFWIEVLAQHGVIVFLLVLIWFGRVTLVAARTRRWTAGTGNRFMHTASVAILVGMTGYLFASVANSTFISQSYNWVFLASIAALAANLEYGQWAVQPQPAKWMRRFRG